MTPFKGRNRTTRSTRSAWERRLGTDSTSLSWATEGFGYLLDDEDECLPPQQNQEQEQRPVGPVSLKARCSLDPCGGQFEYSPKMIHKISSNQTTKPIGIYSSNARQGRAMIRRIWRRAGTNRSCSSTNTFRKAARSAGFAR